MGLQSKGRPNCAILDSVTRSSRFAFTYIFCERSNYGLWN